jgi:hypothetical protein
MIRYAFLSRLGSVAYVAVTYDENGSNLPSKIDGNATQWSRIEDHTARFSCSSPLPIWSATCTRPVSTSPKSGRNRAPSSVLLHVQNANRDRTALRAYGRS